MRAFFRSLPIIVILCFSDISWCDQPDPNIIKACQNKDVGALTALIAQCKDCNPDAATRIITDQADNLNAVSTFSQVTKQSASPGIVRSNEWTAPQPESSESLKHAFGDQKCAAYVANFPADNSKVTFVGTVHVKDHPDAKEEVFKSIREQMNAKNPGAVIVEAPPERMSCVEKMKIYLTPDYNETGTAIQTEADYTMRLALHSNRLLMPGDLSKNEDWGCSEEDKTGFEILREFVNVSKATDVSKLPGADLNEKQSALFNSTTFHAKNGWTYEQFVAWYGTKNKASGGFDMTKSSADLTPAGAPGANQNEINKLAQTIALKRDQNILDKTRAQLSGGSNVMTVFGKDHVETQLGSYESAFGKEPTPVAKCDSGIKSNSNMSSCSK